MRFGPQIERSGKYDFEGKKRPMWVLCTVFVYGFRERRQNYDLKGIKRYKRKKNLLHKGAGHFSNHFKRVIA